ncbi:MAG TPA: copper resistance CopC family protein [Aldersonia sp.]
MRFVLALFGAVAAALLGAAPAAAHSVVVSSNPADGAVLDTGPAVVSVTFNEALQESFASLTVIGPNGGMWSKGDPTISGATISVEVGELGPAGVYTIGFRVTSADGHPVTGMSKFTLSTPGNGTPVSTIGDTGDDDGGVPLWPFVLAAVVVFAGGLFLVLRKPKNG